MKSLMLFLQSVLNDLGTWCCTSTTFDFKTVERRVKHEGLSFLTITLTDYGRDFEKSLDQGFVGPQQFSSFKRSGGLPLFLGGFLDHVFDRATGRLLEKPDVEAIRAIRQISLMFGKIRLECSDARKQAAIFQFLECEKDLRSSDARIRPDQVDSFRRVSRMLWFDLLSRIDRKVYEGEVIPRHGPGQTADRLLGNQKWRQAEWPERLDKVFPAGDFLIPNWRFNLDLANVKYLELSLIHI